MTFAVIGISQTGKPKALAVTIDGDEAQNKFKQVQEAGGKAGKTHYEELILSNLRGILRRKKFKVRPNENATASD